MAAVRRRPVVRLSSRAPGIRRPRSRGDDVPLIRADPRPTKVKPEQPGGMAIPDQRQADLQRDGRAAPPVEQLLPPPETAAAAAGRRRRAAAPAAAATGAPPPQRRPAPTAAPAPPPAKPPQPAAAAAEQTAAPAEPAAPPPAARRRRQGRRHPHPARLGAQRGGGARRNGTRLKREQPRSARQADSRDAVRADLGDKGIYYRIQAGPVADAGRGRAAVRRAEASATSGASLSDEAADREAAARGHPGLRRRAR